MREGMSKRACRRTGRRSVFLFQYLRICVGVGCTAILSSCTCDGRSIAVSNELEATDGTEDARRKPTAHKAGGCRSEWRRR